MRSNGERAIRWALVAALAGLGTLARAQEPRDLRPEVDLLKQSVSEKLQAAADRLGLSQEQRDKIKETHKSFEAQRQALRDQRRELCRADRNNINSILTPEQRTKVD